MNETTKTTMKKVTFRTTGKSHRGILDDGRLYPCCRCPGSQNGKLTRDARIICEGHEQANCGG